MPMFRKKPVVIEAVKWNGYSNNIGLTNGKEGEGARYEMPEWMPPVSRVLGEAEEVFLSIIVPVGGVWRQGECLWIGTLEGSHRADPGDWIIRGLKGELYPCKPDIFAATYEVAEYPLGATPLPVPCLPPCS